MVTVVTAALGGFVDSGGLELPGQVDAALRDEKMQRKLDKLAGSSFEERHLFLSVRPLALTFAVYDTLSFGGPLPSEPPQLPGDLSQLWLASGWKQGGLVRAIAGREWRREHSFD